MRFGSDLEQRLIGEAVGPYTIDRLIGRGGMGHVFLGKHQRMGREVAIKIFAIDAKTTPRAVRRFQREVKATAALQHPHIVSAFDAGEVDDLLYIAMQYIDGWDLSSYVQEFGPLDYPKAVNFILQAAWGLSHAHQNSLIHRDVKPGNLLIDKSDHLRILDLGLARFVDAASPKNTSLTSDSDLFAGSAEFMAPEQSLDFRSADHRSDIYALGCTLHYLLTGKNVFQGNSTVQYIIAHREGEIPSLGDTTSDAPAALDAIFRKMIEKEPEDRYQSMLEVIQALEEFLINAGHEDAIPRQSLPEHAQSVSSLATKLPATRLKPSDDASRDTVNEMDLTQAVPSGRTTAAQRASRLWAIGLTVAACVLAVGIYYGWGGSRPTEPLSDVDAMVLRNTPKVAWSRLTPTRWKASHGTELTVLEDQSILASGLHLPNETYSVAYAPSEGKIAAIKLDALLDPSLPASGPGRSDIGDFHLDAVRIYRSDASGMITPYRGGMHAFCDSQSTSPTTNGVYGLVSPMVPLNWQMYASAGHPNQAVLTLDPPLEILPGGQLVIQLQHCNYNDNSSFNLGRFAISTTSTAYPYQPVHLIKAIQSGAITGSVAKAAALLLDGRPNEAHDHLVQGDMASPDVHFLDAIAHHEAGNRKRARVALKRLDEVRAYRNRICPELAQLEVLVRSAIKGQPQLASQREIWHLNARDTFANLWTIDDQSHQQKVFKFDELANNRAIFGRFDESVYYHEKLIELEPDRIFHRRRALFILAYAGDRERYQKAFSEMVTQYAGSEDREHVNSILLAGLLFPDLIPLETLPVEQFRHGGPVPEREINFDSRIFALIAYREQRYEDAIRFASLPNRNAPFQIALQSRIVEAMSLFQLGEKEEAEALLRTVERSLPYPLLVSSQKDLPEGQLQMLSRWNLLETVAMSAVLLQEARRLIGGNVWRSDIATNLAWESLPELPFGESENVLAQPDQLASVGQFAKAASGYEMLVMEKSLPTEYLAIAGLHYFLGNNQQAYRRIRNDIPPLLETETLEPRFRLAQCYFCAPISEADLETAKLVREVAENDLQIQLIQRISATGYFQFSCGLAAYRMGDFEAAKDYLDGRCRSPISQWSTLDQAAGSVKALIELDSDNRRDAQAIYEVMQSKMKQTDSPVGKGNLVEWLMSRILYRELGDRLADTLPSNEQATGLTD